MVAEFVEGPRGALEVVRAGHGEPVTVFAHGLGASIPSTRPFGSGVEGTRVFMHFPSHGRSAVALEGWDYPHLGQELLAVADTVGATRAVGVSMGAGAVLRILQDDPQRFERVVLVLPAAVDDIRDDATTRRYDKLADASARGEIEVVREQLAVELPSPARGAEAAHAWLDQQSKVFVREGMPQALRALPRARPVVDLAALSHLTLPVLVLAQEGDPVHPVAAAERLTAHLPHARLEIFDEDGLLWGHRARVRALIADFFNDNPHTWSGGY